MQSARSCTTTSRSASWSTTERWRPTSTWAMTRWSSSSRCNKISSLNFHLLTNLCSRCTRNSSKCPTRWESCRRSQFTTSRCLLSCRWNLIISRTSRRISMRGINLCSQLKSLTRTSLLCLDLSWALKSTPILKQTIQKKENKFAKMTKTKHRLNLTSANWAWKKFASYKTLFRTNATPAKLTQKKFKIWLESILTLKKQMDLVWKCTSNWSKTQFSRQNKSKKTTSK